MGYSFYLINKDKDFSENDFETAMKNMSRFNREGHLGVPICDVYFEPKRITISGSYSVSGKYAEGFILNLVMCLLDLDYKPKLLSHDWEYGTKEDWDWFDKNVSTKQT